MKKAIKFFPVIIALAFILACNDNSSTASVSGAGPKQVLHEFFERMIEKDFDGAAKLATQDSKATLDLIKQNLVMAEQFKSDSGERKEITQKFKDVEIGEAKITGDNAVVPYKNTTDNIQVDFPLKKEDSGWKVDFSISTLMQIGMDQAKKHGVDVTPEKINELMKKRDSMMKEMDPVMKRKMEKGMKSYDSLMKAN